MADDLSAPLGLRSVRRRWWKRLPFGVVGGLLMALVATIVGIWVAVIRDPTGGQPMAVASIDRVKTGIARADVAVSVADSARPAAPAETPPMVAGEPGAAGAAGAARPAGEAAEAGGDSGVARRVPEAVEGQPLSTAPVARVTEKGKYGLMPRIASDGSRPLDVYARPAARRPQTTAKVALIVGGLGLSQTGTQEALRVLAPEVTLAFAPYGSSLDRWMARARGDGHELLLQIPMEPFDYPDNDPGPHTLLTSAAADVNLDRLAWLLTRTTNYVGVVNHMGAKFTANEAVLGGILRELAGRGLMFVDDGSSSRSTGDQAARSVKMPFARGDVGIDVVASDDAIEARLAQLEQVARAKGSAIGVANALPITLRHLQTWTKELEARGLVLVPISATARTGPS
ncbi:divergent polysaccharide deacetylase family protein [Siculibacillus lacustris]|uniref:Divergent polysaccharide deacetylase family protein n=1 Tax=Siculibacillus lacustris TaxID=1549641 RepID=A0A4Q9VXD9_9HYPH|nr:divergent polysaccharide deacetylase family protein [Siculibacillus lacustris]TBW39987.1 divergent polysaccharide deacetylase family protein [Siculibacillus lacustris]